MAITIKFVLFERILLGLDLIGYAFDIHTSQVG